MWQAEEQRRSHRGVLESLGARHPRGSPKPGSGGASVLVTWWGSWAEARSRPKAVCRAKGAAALMQEAKALSELSPLRTLSPVRGWARG